MNRVNSFLEIRREWHARWINVVRTRTGPFVWNVFCDGYIVSVEDSNSEKAKLFMRIKTDSGFVAQDTGLTERMLSVYFGPGGKEKRYQLSMNDYVAAAPIEQLMDSVAKRYKLNDDSQIERFIQVFLKTKDKDLLLQIFENKDLRRLAIMILQPNGEVILEKLEKNQAVLKILFDAEHPQRLEYYDALICNGSSQLDVWELPNIPAQKELKPIAQIPLAKNSSSMLVMALIVAVAAYLCLLVYKIYSQKW